MLLCSEIDLYPPITILSEVCTKETSTSLHIVAVDMFLTSLEFAIYIYRMQPVSISFSSSRAEKPRPPEPETTTQEETSLAQGDQTKADTETKREESEDNRKKEEEEDGKKEESTIASQNKEEVEEKPKKKEWTMQDLKSQWRKFNIDLIPKVHQAIFKHCTKSEGVVVSCMNLSCIPLTRIKM